MARTHTQTQPSDGFACRLQRHYYPVHPIRFVEPAAMRKALLLVVLMCVFSAAAQAGRKVQPGKYASVSEALASVSGMKLKHRLSTMLAALKVT